MIFTTVSVESAGTFFYKGHSMNELTRFELGDREAGMARENEQLASTTHDSALREQCWEFARQHWRKAQLLLSENGARETEQLLVGSVTPLAIHLG
jgi:hypothetical protein